jgi:hypothetical protein
MASGTGALPAASPPSCILLFRRQNVDESPACAPRRHTQHDACRNGAQAEWLRAASAGLVARETEVHFTPATMPGRGAAGGGSGVGGYQ